MWNPNMDNRQMEKRVVVGRVRPTWARNLPDARDEDERSDQEGVMPHSEPPSPTEQWEQQAKQEDKYDVFGKVMLLGDSGVGKTCMLVRFRDGTFLAGNYISTVGIDFRVQNRISCDLLHDLYSMLFKQFLLADTSFPI